MRAVKYREELLRQMEEKRQREKEAKQKDMMEDLLLEKRIQQERVKMMQDYEEEQIRLRLRAELMARSEVPSSEGTEGSKSPASRPSSASVRTPSYHQIHPPKSPINRKIRTCIEHKLGPRRGEKSKISLPIDPGAGKPRYDSPKDIVYERQSPNPRSPGPYITSSPMSDDGLLAGQYQNHKVRSDFNWFHFLRRTSFDTTDRSSEENARASPKNAATTVLE